MKEQLTVVKAGGAVLDSDDSLNQLLNEFAQIKGKKLLVHGGGIFINEMCSKLNIETKMIDGRRITSKENMDVVLMTCAGKLNKSLVSNINKLGMTAIGLCGGDLNIIQSHKRNTTPIDFGMVGDVDKVNTEWLQIFIDKNIIPVISSISQSDNFELLNTNADTIASELSIELSKKYNVKLFFYFDKPGVLKDPNNNNSIIKELSFNSFQKGKKEKSIHTGMLPKLNNGFSSLEKGVKEVQLGNKIDFGTKLYID